MFRKTIEPQSRAAKTSAILSLVGGALAYVISIGRNIPFPWAVQIVSVALFTYSIYIASAYIFKRHTVIIESVSGAAEDGDGAYDFIVYESVGARKKKVCDVSVKHIDFVRIVDAENKKTVASDRKNKDRYTYDAQFAASRRLEIAITNGGEIASILLTYDEDILRALVCVGVKKI